MKIAQTSFYLLILIKVMYDTPLPLYLSHCTDYINTICKISNETLPGDVYSGSSRDFGWLKYGMLATIRNLADLTVNINC